MWGAICSIYLVLSGLGTYVGRVAGNCKLKGEEIHYYIAKNIGWSQNVKARDHCHPRPKTHLLQG